MNRITRGIGWFRQPPREPRPAPLVAPPFSPIRLGQRAGRDAGCAHVTRCVGSRPSSEWRVLPAGRLGCASRANESLRGPEPRPRGSGVDSTGRHRPTPISDIRPDQTAYCIPRREPATLLDTRVSDLLISGFGVRVPGGAPRGDAINSPHNSTLGEDGSPDAPPHRKLPSSLSRNNASLTARHQELPGLSAEGPFNTPRAVAQRRKVSSALP